MSGVLGLWIGVVVALLLSDCDDLHLRWVVCPPIGVGIGMFLQIVYSAAPRASNLLMCVIAFALTGGVLTEELSMLCLNGLYPPGKSSTIAAFSTSNPIDDSGLRYQFLLPGGFAGCCIGVWAGRKGRRPWLDLETDPPLAVAGISSMIFAICLTGVTAGQALKIIYVTDILHTLEGRQAPISDPVAVLLKSLPTVWGTAVTGGVHVGLAAGIIILMVGRHLLINNGSGGGKNHSAH